jgi:hypothetical protein
VHNIKWLEDSNNRRIKRDIDRQYQQHKRDKTHKYPWFRMEYDPGGSSGSPTLQGRHIRGIVRDGCYDPGTIFSSTDGRHWRVNDKYKLEAMK